ncbi:MAG: helix-turn-helix domain-containing protein [Clostridia bacterium]|nr:helix-turn-helix domain-containing protein [Clostridia bacterium]
MYASRSHSNLHAAREVGYENYANFYKAFKKAFGESPREKKRNA